MKKITKISLSFILIGFATMLAACGAPASNTLAKNLDESVTDFVYTVSSLDWVEADAVSDLCTNNQDECTPSQTHNSNTSANTLQYQTINPNNTNAQNRTFGTIRSLRGYKTNNSNQRSINNTSIVNNTSQTKTNNKKTVAFTTENLTNNSSGIQAKINELITKRSMLMLYINEIYNGNVVLSDEDVSAINAYINIIKDNTSFMNANKGMIKNQLSYARNTHKGNTNKNLINAYIIRANEAVETRNSKLDSSINALDSIIHIIENGLTENSTFFNNLLSKTYTKPETQNNTSTILNDQTNNTTSNETLPYVQNSNVIRRTTYNNSNERNTLNDTTNTFAEKVNEKNEDFSTTVEEKNKNNSSNLVVTNNAVTNGTKTIQNPSPQIVHQTENTVPFKRTRNSASNPNTKNIVKRHNFGVNNTSDTISSETQNYTRDNKIFAQNNNNGTNNTTRSNSGGLIINNNHSATNQPYTNR